MSSSHIDSKLPSELLPPNSLSDQLLENALVFLFKTKGGSGGRHREEIFHEFATQFKILLQEIYKRLKIDPARAVDIPEYDLNALGFVVLMVRDLRKAIEINREAYKNFPHELQVCVEFLTHINLNPDEKEFCNLHDITNFFVLMHGLNLLDGAIQQFVQHPTETDASSSTSAEMRRISPSAYIRSKIKVATTQVNEWDSLESKAYMTQAFVRETLSAYSARPPKGMVMLRDQWRLMRDKSSFSIICASVTVTLSRLLITGNGRSEDMQKFYKFFTRLWVESSSDFSFFYRDNIFGSLRGEPCFPDRPTLSPRRSLILQNLTGFNQDLKNKIHFYRQALTQLAANHQLYCDVPSLETALKTGSLYPGIHHTEFLAEKLLSRLPSGFFPAHWTFCSLSPLMIDAFLGDSKFVSDELNTKTTNIVAKNKFGATALHLTRDPMIACQIVFAAPDLSLFSIVDEDGYTPLMRAIQREDEAMVEILLKLGSNPNESSPKHGRTSLMVAAQSTENPRIIELLCEHGANVKVTNAEPGIPPKNAFSYAIMAGNISAMATLLACKGTKALPPLSQSVISTVSASHAVAAAIVSETSPEQDELIKLSRGNKHHFQRLLNVLTPPPGTPTQSNQKDAFELAIKRGYTTGKLIIKAALEQLNPTSNGDYAPDTEHQNHGAAELKSDTAPITPPMRPSSAAPARDDLPSMRHFAESLQKALETYKVRRGGDESQSYMALETFLRHLQCYLNSDNRLYRNPEKLLKKLDSALNQRGFLGLHPDSMGVLLANELGYFFDTKRIPLLRDKACIQPNQLFAGLKILLEGPKSSESDADFVNRVLTAMPARRTKEASAFSRTEVLSTGEKTKLHTALADHLIEGPKTKGDINVLIKILNKGDVSLESILQAYAEYVESIWRLDITRSKTKEKLYKLFRQKTAFTQQDAEKISSLLQKLNDEARLSILAKKPGKECLSYKLSQELLEKNLGDLYQSLRQHYQANGRFDFVARSLIELYEKTTKKFPQNGLDVRKWASPALYAALHHHHSSIPEHHSPSPDNLAMMDSETGARDNRLPSNVWKLARLCYENYQKILKPLGIYSDDELATHFVYHRTGAPLFHNEEVSEHYAFYLGLKHMMTTFWLMDAQKLQELPLPLKALALIFRGKKGEKSFEGLNLTDSERIKLATLMLENYVVEKETAPVSGENRALIVQSAYLEACAVDLNAATGLAPNFETLAACISALKGAYRTPENVVRCKTLLLTKEEISELDAYSPQAKSADGASIYLPTARAVQLIYSRPSEDIADAQNCSLQKAFEGMPAVKASGLPYSYCQMLKALWALMLEDYTYEPRLIDAFSSDNEREFFKFNFQLLSLAIRQGKVNIVECQLQLSPSKLNADEAIELLKLANTPQIAKILLNRYKVVDVLTSDLSAFPESRQEEVLQAQLNKLECEAPIGHKVSETLSVLLDAGIHGENHEVLTKAQRVACPETILEPRTASVVYNPDSEDKQQKLKGMAQKLLQIVNAVLPTDEGVASTETYGKSAGVERLQKLKAFLDILLNNGRTPTFTNMTLKRLEILLNHVTEHSKGRNKSGKESVNILLAKQLLKNAGHKMPEDAVTEVTGENLIRLRNCLRELLMGESRDAAQLIQLLGAVPAPSAPASRVPTDSTPIAGVEMRTRRMEVTSNGSAHDTEVENL